MKSTAPTRRVVLIDLAIVAVALGVSLALLSHGIPAMPADARLDGLSATLAACATLPLLMWRRAPFVVFAVSASASAAVAALGYPIGAPIGPTVALYLLAASRDDTHVWTDRTSATVAAGFAAYLIASAAAGGGFPVSEIAHVALAWAAAWFAGERTRLRREHIAELEDRARRAEHDAERERELAAAEERARIARDLHDSAGHAISVIAVRAGAARLRHDADPERSRSALAEIEQVARDTAAEIDAIVRALRSDRGVSDTVEAPPGLASLGTLLERHAAAGLEVTVDTTGEPRPLDGPVDRAAYRILQEALTNAARHGRGGAAVAVAFSDDDLALTIANAVSDAPARQQRGGHGLVGMRERAALLDGSLDAERVNGSFRVRVRLPYGSART